MYMEIRRIKKDITETIDKIARLTASLEKRITFI